MKGHITMSTKEARRVSVLEKFINGQAKRAEVAIDLGVGERQVSRLASAYRTSGVKGLIHTSRGQPSLRKIPNEEIAFALEMIRSDYHDFGPALAFEKLVERAAWRFSSESLRKAMLKEGLYRKKRRKLLVVHQTRTRRARFGELEQGDGSPHHWFEDRAGPCTLLAFIDDATSTIMQMMFADQETTLAYFQLLESYILKHGVPKAIYADKHAVFRVNTTGGSSGDVQDSHGRTQFGRAMDELGIELISAHSPQAKGRVERLNRTLQDRLVKELRLAGISDIAAGNAFLPGFIEAYNARFAKPPSSPFNAHRPLTETECLNDILVVKHTRTLSRNLEFQFLNARYQIQTNRPTYALVNAKIQLLIKGDSIRVFYKQTELQYKVIRINVPQTPMSRKLLDSHLDAIAS